MLSFEEIIEHLKSNLGEEFLLKINEKDFQPSLEIQPENLVKICTFLKKDKSLYFDQLSCLTAIDNGLEANSIDLIYHFNSILKEHFFTIKTTIPRLLENGDLPMIDSVTSIWKTADWHEREAFDLMGIRFNNHPDLRRILLPNDWEGHPLRKDYVEQEIYHDLKVKF
jgi:NADH-quinone oxidoreductase subunit C